MKKITAAEVVENGLRVYFHDQKTFDSEVIAFEPFLLLAADAKTPEGCDIITLAGDAFFSQRAVFKEMTAYTAAVESLKNSPGVMIFRDLLQQALSISGIRLFEDVEFFDLRTLFFALEVDDAGAISRISVQLSDGEKRIFDGAEADNISSFNALIKEFDPDVIGGYNLFRDGLTVLTARAKKCKIVFDCGRDGGTFAFRNSRFAAGEKTISYRRYSLGGRHLVDTLFLAMLYDAAHRDFEDLEVDTLQRYFHIESDFQPEIQQQLYHIFAPAYFYRARVLPLGFQDCIVRGGGSALDALLIAEYLRRNAAIPVPEEARSFTGALSAMEKNGVFHRVRHCDVRSLYPSLLLTMKRNPERDHLGIFLPLLAQLREFRLAAKDRARQLPEGKERQQAEALQSSVKILINSFYGYLGFAQGCFNDYTLAESVTAGGRAILQALLAQLQQLGATVVEMDTDGIYFQMPETAAKEFDASVRSVLPEGIELEFDADYPAMFSYKAKNYALLGADGEVLLTGAALKSRALEGFQRKFIFEAATALLHDSSCDIEKLSEKWRQAIAGRTIPLEDLAKSETLSDSPENYRKKLESGTGRRSAAYELALASGKKYRAGDKIQFYITGTKAKVSVVENSKLLPDGGAGERDENTAYYLAKLDALVQALKSAL